MLRRALLILGLAGACPCGQARAQNHLFTWRGRAAYDLMGVGVGAAGDVNRDGVPDVIAGAPLDDSVRTDAGSATVFSGRDATLLRQWTGFNAGDRFGGSVAGVGDADGDGWPDVTVGAYQEDANGADSGAAYLLSGKDGKVLHAFKGRAAYDYFGLAVAGAGDADGDGRPDVVVGAYGNDDKGPESGSVTVFSGRTGNVLWRFHGLAPGDLLGRSVAGAGDVDGDGRADVIAGAFGADANGKDSGSAYVLSGRDGKILLAMHGDVAGDAFGHAVGGAGDADGDGRPDVIVGAPFDDDKGTSSGSARVFSGRNGNVLFTFFGDAPGDLLGMSVSGAGDVDRDGRGDVIAGAQGHDGGGFESGGARVVSGRTGQVLYTFHGNSRGDLFGVAVSGAGDVNGDGHDDVLAGAWHDDINGDKSGSVTLFSGARLDPGVQRHLYTFGGDAKGDWFGYYVGGAGDVDRDGHDDVVAGALWNGANGRFAGMARVISGRAGRTIHTLRGDGAGDMFGISVRGAGDVNRDGWPDVIAGASQEVVAGGRGYARVVSGKDGSALWTLRGTAAGDWFGYNVSGAMDVDKDGHADVVIGAPYADANGIDSGSASVVSGRTGTVLFALRGRKAGVLFGNSVAGVGDVDRDTWPDVAVGALLDDAAGKDAGSVTVFSGRDGRVLHTLHGPSRGDWFGFAVGAPGDVDRDGHADIVVGAPFTSKNGQWSGAVHVISGRIGSALRSYYGDSAADGLGRAVAGAGDVDRDGWPDVIGGAHGESPNGIASGAAFVWSGRTGKLMFRLDGDSAGDQLGVSVSGAGDVDDDGYADVVVGARLDERNGIEAGTARVASGRAKALTADTHAVSLAAGGTQVLTLSAGAAHAGKLYKVLGTITGTRPGLSLGGVRLPLVMDPWFHFLNAHPNTVLAGSQGVLGTGTATARLQVPPGLPPALANTLLHHAFVVVDLRALSFDLASNAVPLALHR